MPPSRPTYESREASVPLLAFSVPAWPFAEPVSMLAPDSITNRALRPPLRFSVPRKPIREPLSKTRVRLLKSEAEPAVAPVADQVSKPRLARP